MGSKISYSATSKLTYAILMEYQDITVYLKARQHYKDQMHMDLGRKL
jgi:hypothetical protein